MTPVIESFHVASGTSSPSDLAALEVTAPRARARLGVRVVGEKASGAALPDVEVTLGGGRTGARTDATGRAVFESLAPGSCVVSFRRIGFDPHSRAVTLASGEVAELQVGLQSIANPSRAGPHHRCRS